jgi:Ni,Fe-hydrogenase III large subunit
VEISFVLQDMLRGDLDAFAGVGRHEVLHLLETVAGKVGDRLFALTTVHVAVIESYDIEWPHRAQRARMAYGLEGA